MRIAILIGGVLVFVLLVTLGSPLPVMLVALVTGWWPSAIRIFQNMHPGTGTMVLFVLGLAVLIVGSHFRLRWLQSSLSARNEKSIPWRWKWTLGGGAILTLALTAMGSVMLITHQLYWLAQSSDPMVTEISRERGINLLTANILKQQFETNGWNSGKSHADFWQLTVKPFGTRIGEVFQPVWIENDSKSLRGVLLIPRHPLNRVSEKMVLFQPGTNNTVLDLAELPQVLASFGIRNANAESNHETLKP